MEISKSFKVSLLSILVVISISLQGQFNVNQNNIYKNIYTAANNELGFDQELVNGIYFEYNYRNALGHPYLLDDAFHEGNVVFRGKQYFGLKFKYDIYEQELLVQYPHNESKVIFYLPKEHITEFTILEMNFIKLGIQDDGDQFYQVIGKNMPIKAVNKWRKQRNDSDHMMPFLSYEFSKSHKSTYLFINKQLMRYRANRSFVKKFNKTHQKSIKQHIKSNDIKVKHCSPKELASLLAYCNSLYSEANY